MARKHKHEEHENLERWLVSYADFITLLFAFFTILYALSQTDKAKYKNAIESIQRAFMSPGGVFPLRGSPFTPFEKAPDKGSQVPPGANEHGKFSKTEAEMLERIAEQINGMFLSTTGLAAGAGDIEIIRSAEGFKIRLGEAMLFKPGSDKLIREQIPFLYEVGRRLADMNYHIQIEGHSDGLEGRKPASTKKQLYTDGWHLSVNRAFNMGRFLAEGANFPVEHLSMAGYGDAYPIAENDSPEGRQKNRRVEISVITPDHSLNDLKW